MKENSGVFYESRSRLIKLGLLIPGSIFLSLDKDSPARIEYELKMIKCGIDTDTSKDVRVAKIVKNKLQVIV